MRKARLFAWAAAVATSLWSRCSNGDTGEAIDCRDGDAAVFNSVVAVAASCELPGANDGAGDDAGCVGRVQVELPSGAT